MTRIDFEDWPPGTLLFRDPELPGGATFDPAVEVVECAGFSACETARSGANVAVALPLGEFARHPFTVYFATPQRRVSLSVKREVRGAPLSTVLASLNAYDEAGLPVGSANARLGNDTGWQLLRIGSEFVGPRIRRVVLSGGEEGAGSPNFVLVDDLEFDGVEAAPPAPDVEPPRIEILAPAPGTTVVVPRVDVRVRVQEDRTLASVVARLRDDASGATIGGGADFCGTSFSVDRVCPSTPPIVYDRSATAALAAELENGPYSLVATACDGAGNCASAERPFTFELPETPPLVDVRVLKVEVNQAVQNALFDVDGPGTATPASSSVPLVPEKPMLVRFYVVGVGDARPGFTGRLRLRLWRDGDTPESRTVLPNLAGLTAVDLPPDPVDPIARRDLLLRLRANVGGVRTLNFVVPGGDLADVRRLELTLLGPGAGHPPITGRLQIALDDPVRLGVNIVRINTTPNVGTILNNVIPYLRASYPVSEVRVLSADRRLGVLLGSGLATRSRCSRFRSVLRSVYGGGDVPARFATEDPHFTVTLGVLSGTRGCAARGNPNDDGNRERAVSIIRPAGDNAAHEVAHMMSLRHAGNAHGECGGGACERGFPNPHGTLRNALLDSDFGVILLPPAATGGPWNAWLVDPCPTPATSARFPCAVSDVPPAPAPYMPHDLMSYGSPPVPMGFPLNEGGDMWMSSLTYRRLYEAIRFRRRPDLFAMAALGAVGAGAEERVEAYLIRGFVEEDAELVLLPVLRKPARRSDVERTRSGPYELELWGAGDALLHRRSFDVEPEEDGQGVSSSMHEIVPFVDGVERLVIRREGVILAERTASPSPPRVRLLEPSRGEIEPGEQTVAWEAEDDDGDLLSFLLQHSPDGGRTWSGLALIESREITELEVTVPEAGPDGRGMIRITASDGLNTAVDVYKEPLVAPVPILVVLLLVILVVALLVWWRRRARGS